MSAVAVHVLGVSGDAEAIAEQIAAAGHTVSGPQSVSAEQVADAVAAAPGADVVVVVGDVGPSSALPAVVLGICDPVLPGFAEFARQLARSSIGADAQLMRPVGGIAGDRSVFLVPAAADVAGSIVGELILKGPVVLAQEASGPQVAEPAAAANDPVEPPTGVAHQATHIGLAANLDHAEAPDQPVETEVPNRGWKRAVLDLKAEVFIGKREDLPEPIEKLAPVVNVLHTAGEFGMLKLPNGRRYSLYGWPDLRRPNAKVLAVSWGDPLAEVVALHRYPDRAGTLIPGKLGILDTQDSNVDALSEQIVGAAPPTAVGRPFAIDTGVVWILNERRVTKWDGTRERDDGNPKQVLASLTLQWSSH